MVDLKSTIGSPNTLVSGPDEGQQHNQQPSFLLSGPDGLFEKIRAHVATKTGQGLVFERLTKAFLSEDPLFKQRFNQVWLWSEWPGNAGEHDSGIDLIAKEENGGLCAIQCKFYSDDHYINRDGIDRFLVASSRLPFTSRMFVATTERWSSYAESAISGQAIPVQRIGIAEFQQSPFDWSRFDPDHPDQLARHSNKAIRTHQHEAIRDVLAGFETSDRGKLIMACGTGKTFTSLQIAEQLVAPSGTVLFCVPSISLLSQTLRSWSTDGKRPQQSLVVCSDSQVTKGSEDIRIYDLALPATTDAQTIAQYFEVVRQKSKDLDNPMTVVFSTYQSLERVVEAQEFGLPTFDLVIADEAHRTTGALEADEKYSGFTMVHDDQRLKARRRLYMTATPRLYSDNAKAKAKADDFLICSMDDEALYGPEFHHLGFGKAVTDQLLSDYRVIVLMVDAADLTSKSNESLEDNGLESELEDAARLAGCWRALSKQGAHKDDFSYDSKPMKRVVSFSNTIDFSKRVAADLPRVMNYLVLRGETGVNCETQHVDGGMGALEREQKLSWLREESAESSCRVLTNARCLSEGVDVPGLDAVIFTNPRNSQIDVVQSVGRVMRKAPGKSYGYVIIPIPVKEDEDPEQVLDGEQYKVVWQVLQALRAHDERFDAEINKLDLQRDRAGRIQFIGKGGTAKEFGSDFKKQELQLAWQGLEDKVFARIVKRVGKRTYWEDWAKDVAEIAKRHSERITTLLDDKDEVVVKVFEDFVQGLRSSLNDSITNSDAIEMLSQHLITRPIFEALFSDYSFARQNPVSIVMENMINMLDEHNLDTETESLDRFYESVRQRAAGIDNAKGRQRIIIELYEKFFKIAFPKVTKAQGVVYTPVELVDFIIKSVEKALTSEFGASLNDTGVHVLDPFTGTGTFIVRLIQSGIISPESLIYKYTNELHANEVILLAYYIAAINIEAAFHDVVGQNYQPFEGIVLTDTFELGEDEGSTGIDPYFPANSERAQRQRSSEIQVIIGNPPYSVGQGSENDNNKNQVYTKLDRTIRDTYASLSNATLKKSLNDSYIRAFRWASDRIGERGIVCFVTNGAFIDSSAADGFRKALANEYSSIWCLNLRGGINGRTGDRAKREGGNPFNIKTSVAITVLVKNPNHLGPARIFYHDVGDYLSREEKLEKLVTFEDISGVDWLEIAPNDAGDWINHRSREFETFTPLGDKKASTVHSIFETYSGGVKTNRDAWTYNFSKDSLLENMQNTIEVYNSERARIHALVDSREASLKDIDSLLTADPTKISWDGTIKADLKKNKPSSLDLSAPVVSMYRPFCKQWLYFDRQWDNSVYRMPSLFPTPEHENRVIAVSGRGSGNNYSVQMVGVVPCNELAGAGNTVQCFPRYRYSELDPSGAMFGERFERHDAISQIALDTYRARYGADVTADDIFYYIYGVLHSLEYRTRFAADLGKMIPRIPMVESFHEFQQAGRRLADLHLGYETVAPWPLDGLPDAGADPRLLRVEKLRFARSGKSVDRSTIIVNDHLTLGSIPQEAYRYEVNGRSAIAWIMDRYQVKIDKKSKLVNDPNTWSNEPDYIVQLIARIVRVSIDSTQIIDSLTQLGISDSGGNYILASEKGV